mgnify:CR=1 FL=1
MFELMVEDTFDAAHQLKGYEGPCERLHGHTFRVQVFLKGAKLNKIGLLEDFKVIKRHLKKVTDEFDHTNLNELKCFIKSNPTSENIAKIFYGRLKAKIDIYKVSIWESGTSCATYWEQKI